MRCIFRKIAASLAVAVLLVPALAAQQSAAGRRVTRLNNEVLSVYTRSVRARGERPALRQQAQELLEERKQALAALAAQSPDEALDAALPADLAGDLARAFPESSARIERHGSLIGILETEVEDGENLQEHKVIRHVRVGRDRFRVHFSDDAPIASSGSLVQLNGMLVGETMVAESSGLTSANAVVPSCSTTGAQRLAVLKVRPPEVAASLANSTLDNWMFGSSGMTVNNYWQENSGGAAWAEGDVYPSGADAWYTLDREYSCSESNALRDAAMDAADADVNYNNYQRVVIVFPKPSGGCSFAGGASIGCWVSSPNGNTVSYALQVLTSMDTAQKAVQLTTHEGGHTLGLSHASTVDYGAEPLGATNDSGSKAEYGDRYSTMGFWTDGHYAAPHKDRLNWISSQYVSSAGSFVIKPYSSASGTTALEIKRGSSGSQSLWLEYRRQLGDFNSGPPDSPANGALVHVSGSSNSLLLDFTPDSKTGGSTTPNDFLDAPLQSGQTWEDPYSDLAIQIGSASNSGLQVNVSYGNTPTCSTNPPTISVSPNSKSADYPAAASYTVSVDNNDGSACSSSSFTITSNALFNSQSTGDVSTSLNNPVLTISPGSTANTTLTATPTALPPEARSYVVSARAARANPEESATDLTGFTVVPPLQYEVGFPSISISPVDLSAEVLWQAGHETGDISEWDESAPWSSGPGSRGWRVTSVRSHTGLYSLESTIDTTAGTAGLRWARRYMPDGNPWLPDVAYYSVWFYLPDSMTSTWWNFMQWKRAFVSDTSSGSDPVASVNLEEHSADGALFFSLNYKVGDDGGYKTPGWGNIAASPIDIPLRTWVHLECKYRWSIVAEGEITCWQDGQLMWSLVGLKTEFDYTGAMWPRQWAVNAYGSNVSPSPYTLYFDDAAISSTRLGVDRAVCAPNLPTLSMSPNSMSTEYPDSATYSVTLTNNDSEACGTSTFSLTSKAMFDGSATTEISSVVADPGLSIAPGATATTVIMATPMTLPEQSRAYLVTARASRESQTGAAQGAVGLTVVPPPTNPPPPTAVSTVQISVLGKRGSVAVSPLGLSCKDNCTITLTQDEWQTLTLQAVPSGQSCVQAIRGCNAGGGSSCILTAGVSYEVEVEFAPCRRRGGGEGGGKGRVKQLADTNDAIHRF